MSYMVNVQTAVHTPGCCGDICVPLDPGTEITIRTYQEAVDVAAAAACNNQQLANTLVIVGAAATLEVLRLFKDLREVQGITLRDVPGASLGTQEAPLFPNVVVAGAIVIEDMPELEVLNLFQCATADTLSLNNLPLLTDGDIGVTATVTDFRNLGVEEIVFENGCN
jgi:hypothetical protein